MNPSQTIGTYETKTRLAEILRQVQQGQAFVITQRGQPVAELLPTGTALHRAGAEAAEKMRRFVRSRASSFGAPDVKALLDEGRD